MEALGRDAHRAVAQDDELLEIVARRHAHFAPPAQLVGHALDVAVRRLGFLRVDHEDIVVFFHGPEVQRHLIRIKHQNYRAAAIALIVAEQIHQHVPRRVEIAFCQLLQLVPREEDIVAVDEDKLLRRFQRADQLTLVVGAQRLHWQNVAAADGPICPLEDGQQLFFEFRRAAVGHRARDLPRRGMC